MGENRLICAFWVATVLLLLPDMIGAQDVVFKVNGGIDDAGIRSSIERNVTGLLCEMEVACQRNSALDLSHIDIDDKAKVSLGMLWGNVQFKCEERQVVERVLTTYDGGYQVRNIPVMLTHDDTVEDEGDYQEAVVDFDSMGRITSFYFGLRSNLYRQVMVKGKEVEDFTKRQMILDYVEHFRTAYNEKDIHFLEQVFSEDALIITGKVVKARRDDINPLAGDKITYNVQNKRQYLARLKNVFANTRYIKVDFSEVKVSRHPTKQDFYGVLLRQGYRSSIYSDEGYVFLLWDFTDAQRPQIHVRTWQPYWMDEDRTRPIDQSEIMNVNKFNIK